VPKNLLELPKTDREELSTKLNYPRNWLEEWGIFALTSQVVSANIEIDL